AGTTGGSAGTTGGSGGSTGGTAGSGGTTGGAAGTTGGSAGTTGGSAGTTGGSAGAGGTTGGTAGTGGTGGSSAGTSVTITTDGGRLEFDGASLTFGQNAVTGNTVITGSSTSSTSGLPRAGDIQGKVYDLTPNGTKFDDVGVLTLPVSGAAPTGKQWFIAWLDTTNNVWIPVPTLQLTGRVAAPINHFTYYAVLQGNAADVTSGCNIASPCGGTLASHYDLGGFCFTGTPPGAGPFPTCSTDSTGSVGTVGGSLFEFNGGNFVYSLTVATKTTFHMQPTCVSKIESGLSITVSQCSELDAPLSAAMKMAMVCEGNPATQCDCSVFPSVADNGVETGTYSTAGTKLTLVAPSKTDTIDYCVSGNTLQMTLGEFEYIYNE
ncbi:MAG: hypothetical protein KC492_06215, partial [Myxococcales bacterium]|nr:hypothetical protein [Myxococcales bacterium]